MYASGIYCENTPEFDDLFGFSVKEVMKEIKRGSRLVKNAHILRYKHTTCFHFLPVECCVCGFCSFVTNVRKKAPQLDVKSAAARGRTTTRVLSRPEPRHLRVKRDLGSSKCSVHSLFLKICHEIHVYFLNFRLFCPSHCPLSVGKREQKNRAFPLPWILFF